MPLPLYLYIFIQLLIVSWGDLRDKKIFNFWTILNLITYIILLFLFPETYYFSWSTLIFSFSFLIVGFILFSFRVMGGGDSKYLFGFFFIVPPALEDQTFESILLSTILIGSFVLITNFAKNFDIIIKSLRIGDVKALRYCLGSKFSFAPVILLSWGFVGWQIKEMF
jgi:prepilin peptidase CpaA